MQSGSGVCKKELQARYGPESVAGISTGQLTLEEFALFGHVMRNADGRFYYDE